MDATGARVRGQLVLIKARDEQVLNAEITSEIDQEAVRRWVAGM